MTSDKGALPWISNEDLRRMAIQHHQNQLDAYNALRLSERRWSHNAATAIINGCGADAGIPWPLVYRKQAESWWKERTQKEASELLSKIAVVKNRKNPDYDILDGREVVRCWKTRFQSPMLRETCGEECRRDEGFCYVMVHEPFMQRFKIGKAAVSSYRRSKTLSNQAGILINVVSAARFCCYDSAGQTERLLHAKYQERRLLGEWFKSNDFEEVKRIAAFVESLSQRVTEQQAAELGFMKTVALRISIFNGD